MAHVTGNWLCSNCQQTNTDAKLHSCVFRDCLYFASIPLKVYRQRRTQIVVDYLFYSKPHIVSQLERFKCTILYNYTTTCEKYSGVIY